MMISDEPRRTTTTGYPWRQVFNSAADIVSGAYPMLSRPSVRPSTFLPLSPPGWRGIVVWAGGRAGGCQTCGTHISVTAWRIFSIRSSVELSRPVVVSFVSFAHLPHMGLPMGQKLVKFATNWVQTLRNADLWNGWMDLPHSKFHGLV